jgi:hypothetical protein
MLPVLILQYLAWTVPFRKGKGVAFSAPTTDRLNMARKELNALNYPWVAASDVIGCLDAIGCASEADAERIVKRGRMDRPLRLVGISNGETPTQRLRDYLPVSDLVPPFEESPEEYQRNPAIDFEDDWVFLDETWLWERIKADAQTQGPGHAYKCGGRCVRDTKPL